METGPRSADVFDAVVRTAGDGVVINVHVQPRAGRAGIVGRHGDALRVRVKAPPVGGRANDEVAALLAAALHVPGHDVTLVAGATSRLKRFLIAVLGQGRAKECLTQALDGNGA